MSTVKSERKAPPQFARAVLAAALLGVVLTVFGACDGDNLFSGGGPITQVPDSALPSVEIIDPIDGASAPLTNPLLVRADIADASGIKRVRFQGVAIRGDSATNTTIVTRFTEVTVDFPQPPSPALPRDTTLLRFLTPVAGDNSSEAVLIIVTVTDSLDNVRADTNRITVGGPSVTLRNPVDGSVLQINGTVQITADANDPTVGLDSMKVYITGVITDSIVVKNLNGVASRTIDQAFPVGTSTGTATLVARAWNRLGIPGVSQTSTVTIQTTSAADTEAPNVSVNLNAPTRVEVDDTISVTVRAADVGASGLARVGVTIIAIPDTTAETTDTLFLDTTFAPPRGGTLDKPFVFRLADFLEEETAGTPQRFGETSSLRFPRRFTLEIHAFGIDAAGNCGAAVSNTTQSLACLATPSAPPAPIPNTFRVASAPAGLQGSITATLGSSVVIPGGGRIADALVDPARQRLYLSNIAMNRIEVFNAATNTFIPTGPGGIGLVGSQPWGLAFNSRQSVPGVFDNDTLLVANSGGTNVSFVSLGGADDLREDVPRRLLTPNTVLFEITLVEQEFLRYTGITIDFSDRPQFITVDADGLILYSTVPTGSAPDGTIRYVDTNPDPLVTTDRPETKILFNTNAVTSVPEVIAIANIDSVLIVRRTSEDDDIILYDHLPGTTTVIQSPAQPVDSAVTSLRLQGSDILDFAGRWNIEGVAMSDTTFVATSTDRRRVAFGEGATAQTGRILLCCSKSFNPTPGPGLQVGVSREVAVVDLINNASERVLGVGLNNDGQLGVARGTQGAYFFTADNTQTNELRLQGVFNQGIAGGAGGAALHPSHVGVTTTANALSFVATPTNSIKIIDTVHFFERGNVPIRDNVVGPLRATLPFPGENGALLSTDPNFIVVKLFGVTTGGQVVVVNVRNKDLVN